MVKKSQQPRIYPLPVYLNYKSVIDLTAVIDDGFSDFVEVRTRYTGREDNSVDSSQGDLGISSRSFSIINVGETPSKSAVSQEDVHEGLRRKVQTNTSLFAKLRDELYKVGVVTTSYENAKEGCFIEMRGSFSKPPLFEAMDALMKAMELGASFQQGGQTNKHKPQAQIPKEVKLIKGLLDASSAVDLVFTTSDNRKNVVSLDKEVLGDKSVDDILAGEYVLFAKLTTIISKDSSWNSLQKTDLRIFEESAAQQLFDSFNTSDMGEAKKLIKLPEKIETTITGPLLYLQPIAIFS